MKTPDYSLWLTKAQAAEAIGCSTKTIEQLAQKGKIEQAEWKRPETGARIAVYHPDDVNRVRKERNPEAKPFVLPAAGVSESPNSAALIPRASPAADPGAFLKALAALVSQKSEKPAETPPVALSERAFLTIPEAAAFTGLGEGYIRRQIKAGNLKPLKGAGRHGADVIRRKDLEEL